jgi:hypothetical protein
VEEVVRQQDSGSSEKAQDFDDRESRIDKRRDEHHLLSYGLNAKEIDVARKNIKLDNRENSLLNKAEEVTITAKGLVDKEAALLEKLAALRQVEEGLKIEVEAFKNKKRGFNVDMAKLQFNYENKERTFNLHMTQRQSEIGYSDRAIKTHMRSWESRTRALDKKDKNLDLKLRARPRENELSRIQLSNKRLWLKSSTLVR